MSSSPDRMVAGLIGDRYEITGLIASGGMGAVYRARDQVLDRTVAVKVLKNGGDDPEFVAKFKAEATNAARLSHPNIVQVFDFGYENGQPYMAMEFVDGQNLREILTARKLLRPDVAARIALQVASALEHARRNGLSHRDIKPENILITTDGVVKVGRLRALARAGRIARDPSQRSDGHCRVPRARASPRRHRRPPAASTRWASCCSRW